MSAVVVGSFTWPNLGSLTTVAYTMVRICWYNSLILAIAAVAVGMQQSVFLTRVGCLSTSDVLIVRLLSFEGQNGRRVPRRDQVIIWQTAVGLLEFSLYFWLSGFIVFVWDVTLVGRKVQKTSDKVVCTSVHRKYGNITELLQGCWLRCLYILLVCFVSGILYGNPENRYAIENSQQVEMFSGSKLLD